MSTEIHFADLGLAQPLLHAIIDAGYTVPTPIQAQAIPLVLAGGDLLAAAQTGTAKPPALPCRSCIACPRSRWRICAPAVRVA